MDGRTDPNYRKTMKGVVIQNNVKYFANFKNQSSCTNIIVYLPIFLVNSLQVSSLLQYDILLCQAQDILNIFPRFKLLSLISLTKASRIALLTPVSFWFVLEVQVFWYWKIITAACSLKNIDMEGKVASNRITGFTLLIKKFEISWNSEKLKF